MDEFNFGDRVICSYFKDNIGTVMVLPSEYDTGGLYGIAFDNQIDGGHNLNTIYQNNPKCKKGRVWYVSEFMMKHCEPEILVSIDDFNSMFE